MKILHLSDVHLGAKFAWLGAKADAHRERIWTTLSKVTAVIKSESIQLVVFAGDTFDNPQPASRERERLAALFGDYVAGGAQVVVIPGNHDHAAPGTVWATWTATPGVKVLLQPDAVEITPKLWLAAVPVLTEQTTESPLPFLTKTAAELRKIHPDAKIVALAHAGTRLSGKETAPGLLEPQALADLAVDYLALGDWHSYLEVGSGQPLAVYSGSPEILRLEQTGAGQAVLVDLAGKAQARRIRLSELTAEQSDYPLAQLGAAGLRAELSKHANPQKLLRIDVVGELAADKQLPDLGALQAEFASQYYYLELRNRASLMLNSADLAAYPENSLARQFLELLDTEVKAQQLSPELAAEIASLGIHTITGGKS